MIYTVTFNPALDYVMWFDGIQQGAVNLAKSCAVTFGGKGINVSAVLKQLGVSSVALGFTAGFTGEAIEQSVREHGITADFIRLEHGCSRINVKLKAEEETELNGQGPIIDENALSQLFRKLDALVQGDTLILAGSITSSLPEDIYEQICAGLYGRGIRFIVDAAGKLLMNVLKYRPFLIKPNDHELSGIFERELRTDAEIVECAQKLREMGAANVLVSLAGEGAILLDEHGDIHRIGVPEGTVVNSVGAGDSMVAGFTAGYALKGDHRYALELGTAAGSATAFSQGLAQREDIMRLLAQVQGGV